MNRVMCVLVMVLMLGALPTLGQEATPEVTPEVTPESTPELIFDVGTAQALLNNPLEMALPDGTPCLWRGFILWQGSIVLQDEHFDKLAEEFTAGRGEDVPTWAQLQVVNSDDGYYTLLEACWTFYPDRSWLIGIICGINQDRTTCENNLTLTYFGSGYVLAAAEPPYERPWAEASYLESAAAARAWVQEHPEEFDGDPSTISD